MLHLIPSWERALAEARRVLAPGLLLHAGGSRLERGSGSPRDQVISRFEELAGASRTPRLVGATHEQVLGRLRAMGGRVEELEPVVWEEQETHAEALRWIDERVFSYHWRLPDEVWRSAAAQVRAELEAAHPDLDTPPGPPHLPVPGGAVLTRRGPVRPSRAVPTAGAGPALRPGPAARPRTARTAGRRRCRPPARSPAPPSP